MILSRSYLLTKKLSPSEANLLEETIYKIFTQMWKELKSFTEFEQDTLLLTKSSRLSLYQI